MNQSTNLVQALNIQSVDVDFAIAKTDFTRKMEFVKLNSENSLKKKSIVDRADLSVAGASAKIINFTVRI